MLINKSVIYCFILLIVGCTSDVIKVHNIGEVIGDRSVLDKKLIYEGFLGPCEKNSDLSLFFYSDEKACNNHVMDKSVFVDLSHYCSQVECESFRGKIVIIVGKIRYINEPAVQSHGLTDIEEIQLAKD